jgi:hypothetical protein
MNQNGKGDTPRPLSVDYTKYANNWERTFARREPSPDYVNALASGMFFELFPELTGNWELDKVAWYQLHSGHGGTAL